MASNSTIQCSGYVGRYYATNPKVEDYYEFYIVNSVLNAVSALPAIVGNSLVFVGILTTPRLRGIPSYWLISSQVFTDLGLGLCQPMISVYMIAEMKRDNNHTCALALITMFTCFFLLTATGIGLTALSVDRFLAIRLKTRYKTFVTSRRVTKTIVFQWLFALLLAIIAVLSNNHRHISIMFLCFVLTCNSITMFCYTSAVKLLRAHMKEISPKQTEASNPKSQPNNLNATIDVHKYKKSLWTMILIVFLMMIFGTPLAITWIYLYIYDLNVDGMNIMYATTTFFNLNCTVNPLIYILRMNDIKSACKTLVRKMWQFFKCYNSS